MKFSIATALLALLPTLGWSCAVYEKCRCAQDGKVHEAATKLACARNNGNILQHPDGIYCAAGVVNSGVGGAVSLAFNNCKWKELCNNHGTSGDSQWCWSKIGF